MQMNRQIILNPLNNYSLSVPHLIGCINVSSCPLILKFVCVCVNMCECVCVCMYACVAVISSNFEVSNLILTSFRVMLKDKLAQHKIQAFLPRSRQRNFTVNKPFLYIFRQITQESAETAHLQKISSPGN